MESWWQAVILGVVEGLTEFLPISSTGHLLLAAQLLGFQHSNGGTFEVFIQLGAVLAVLGYFRRDLIAQSRAAAHDLQVRRFGLAVLVACLPAALMGLVLHGWIKAVLFTSPIVIAWALIAGGLALVALERWSPCRATTHHITQVSLRQALWIGLTQVLALVPGVSRSGASIAGGMLAGLDRTTATAFSFYLAIPTLGAATVLDLLGSLPTLTPDDLGQLVVGTLVALVVAWASIRWLLHYVASHSFVLFGLYRVVVGLAILALVATGVV